MQKYYLTGILVLLTVLTICAQSLVIQTGSVSIYGNTNLSLVETSIINNSDLSANDSATMSISGTENTLEIAGTSSVSIANLKIAANCDLNTELALSGDVIMSSGLFKLNYALELGGSIYGEREESRITTSGQGEIIKKVSLINGNTLNPGNMGLEITPQSDYTDIEIHRVNEAITNGDLSGILRSFTIPIMTEPATVRFSFFEAELNGFPKDKLALYGEYEGSWNLLQGNIANLNQNQFTGTLDKAYSRITLFESVVENEISIPTGFSPNNDGVNDVFIIPDAEKYPNNELILFNQWGDILYDSSPYQNNWDGTTDAGIIKTDNKLLSDGTYFYIFYPNKSDKTIYKKGFVELKTGNPN